MQCLVDEEMRRSGSLDLLGVHAEDFLLEQRRVQEGGIYAPPSGSSSW